MIFTVGESKVAAVSGTGEWKYLLIDSGACESVARTSDLAGKVDDSVARPLYSVQGNPLRVLECMGSNTPPCQLEV